MESRLPRTSLWCEVACSRSFPNFESARFFFRKRDCGVSLFPSLVKMLHVDSVRYSTAGNTPFPGLWPWGGHSDRESGWTGQKFRAKL